MKTRDVTLSGRLERLFPRRRFHLEYSTEHPDCFILHYDAYLTKGELERVKKIVRQYRVVGIEYKFERMVF